MANPQREHGYTAIANEIMDALAKYRIPGEKRQVLDLLFRKTYGYNRKRVTMSYSDIAAETNLHRQAIKRSVAWLRDNLVLIIVPTGNKNSTRSKQTFEFNKNYEQWIPVKKKKSGNIISTSSGTIISTRSKNVPFIRKQIKQSKNFDSFWKEYPQKKAKKKSMEIWNRLEKKKELPPIGKIIKAISDQKAEKEYLQNNGKFCPEWKHPTTWLNQGCWDDDVSVPEDSLPKYIYKFDE